MPTLHMRLLGDFSLIYDDRVEHLLFTEDDATTGPHSKPLSSRQTTRIVVNYSLAVTMDGFSGMDSF